MSLGPAGSSGEKAGTGTVTWAEPAACSRRSRRRTRDRVPRVVATDASTVAASMVTMTDTGSSATVAMTGVDTGTTAGAAGLGGSRVADAIGARPVVMTRTAASPLSVVIIRRVRDLGRRAEATRAGEGDWSIAAAPPERQGGGAPADPAGPAPPLGPQ